MAKYNELDHIFAELDGSEIEFSFDEIEATIGDNLPRSAHVYPSWWRAADNAPWRAYGWKAYPNLRSRTVRFTRAKQVPPSSTEEPTNKTVSEVLSSARRLILVAGVSGKKDTPLRAKDLYESSLWEKRRGYAEATGSPWMILSSEYGIIHPDTVIEPYDAEFSRESLAYRSAWSERVAAEVISICRVQGIEVIEAHAGSDQLLNGLVGHLNAAGLTVSWPLRGRRIGEQMSWYALAIGAVQSLPRGVLNGATAAMETATNPVDAGESVDSTVDRGTSTEMPVEDGAATTAPRVIVMIASAVNRLRLAFHAVGRAISQWLALLAAEVSRREEVREPEESHKVSLRQRVKLAESIAHFGETRSQILEALDKRPWTGDLEADRYLRSNPFGFLVGIIMDQGGADATVWGAPWMLQERMGQLSPNSVLAEPEQLLRVMEGPPALHRSPTKIATWIQNAAETVLDTYEGDASIIWREGSSREDVRLRLERFDGIGPRQSSRAIEVLQSRMGVRLSERSRGPMAYEADLRRVMLRSGLAEFDDIEHMTMSMSALYPEDPGSLDLALLAIGNLWCHPVDPECEECAIGVDCPRFIEPSGGVPQMGQETEDSWATTVSRDGKRSLHRSSRPLST